MKYSLGMLERIVLVQILQEAPKMGSRLYYKEFEKVASVISISQKEQDAIGWRVENGNVAWDGSKDKPREVEIPNCISKIIREGLSELDKQGKLRPEHLPVYDMFIPQVEDDSPVEHDEDPA